MQVPGGWAAQKYGGRVTLIVSFLLWSTGSLLTPRSAQSTRGITAARVLVGIAQGGIIPSIHTVLSQVANPPLCSLRCSYHIGITLESLGHAHAAHVGFAENFWLLPAALCREIDALKASVGHDSYHAMCSGFRHMRGRKQCRSRPLACTWGQQQQC